MTHVTDWNSYVGIPFVVGGRDLAGAGCDCYGLVRGIFSKELGVVLPRLDIFQWDLASSDDLGNRLKEFTESYTFPPCLRETSQPIQEFDILWLRSIYPIHYGLAISATEMIHVELGKDSVTEPFDSGRWKNKVLGVYRHESFA